MIINVPSIFLVTRFFMSEPSILRLIIISLAIIYSLVNDRIAICSLVTSDCWFVHEGSLHFTLSFFSWQTLNVYNCIIVSLRGDISIIYLSLLYLCKFILVFYLRGCIRVIYPDYCIFLLYNSLLKLSKSLKSSRITYHSTW